MHLLDSKLGPQEKVRKVCWDPDVLNEPVFKGAKGRILTAGTFTQDFRELQLRAGFPQPAGLQDLRAENLTKIGQYNKR